MPKPMNVRTVIAAILACSASAHAAADEAMSVNIPAGDLRQALLAVSEKYGTDLVYRPEHIRGVSTSGAHGDLTTEQAIYSLLQGTPLELRTDSSGAILIAQAPTQPEAQPSSRARRTPRRRPRARPSRPQASKRATRPSTKLS